MTSRPVLFAFMATVLASALHFADNAARFTDYHDPAPSWLNPVIVVLVWFLQIGVGLIGLRLDRQGNRAGRPVLLVYATFGFAGLLHYLAPPPTMDPLMHASIAGEALASVALLFVLQRNPADSSPSSSPNAAFK